MLRQASLRKCRENHTHFGSDVQDLQKGVTNVWSNLLEFKYNLYEWVPHDLENTGDEKSIRKDNVNRSEGRGRRPLKHLERWKNLEPEMSSRK